MSTRDAAWWLDNLAPVDMRPEYVRELLADLASAESRAVAAEAEVARLRERLSFIAITAHDFDQTGPAGDTRFEQIEGLARIEARRSAEVGG